MSNEFGLSLAFLGSYPEESASELEKLDPQDVAAFFENVAPGLAAGVLEKMLPWPASQCLVNLKPETAASLVQTITAPQSTIFLRLIPKEPRESIFAGLPESKRKTFNKLLSFPEEMIGAWMDPLVVSVPSSFSAEEALKISGRFKNSLGNYLFVTHREGAYAGIVFLRDILFAKKKALISEILKNDVKSIQDRASLESAKFAPEWKEFNKLPVVDRKKRLVGELHYAGLCKGLSLNPEEHIPENIGSLVAEWGEVYFNSLSELVSLVTKVDLSSAQKKGQKNER
ncbi:MAG: hypothetical protein NPINA01_25200 [Nitrospinaceae bacterium]|nr:MAG: hypothetical protein NPINA01_25200 [Nitrospinaceae bacterium]